jgi:hypothetical protein
MYVLPGIGRGRASLVGTLSLVFWQLGVYAGQFESVVERWKEEQFDLVLGLLCLEQIKDVGTKELELLGVSSGSRTAGGGHDYIQHGVVAAGLEKEVAET